MKIRSELQQCRQVSSVLPRTLEHADGDVVAGPLRCRLRDSGADADADGGEEGEDAHVDEEDECARARGHELHAEAEGDHVLVQGDGCNR